MKYEQSVQVELQEYICMVKRIDGVVAQKALEQELIRCKDCKWWNADTCMGWYDTPYTPPDGFCYKGKRKEE